MSDISDLLPLVDRDMNPEKTSNNVIYPEISYQKDFIQNIGSGTEKIRMDLIVALIKKRKHIRDVTLQKLDDLIIYCDNRILEIGTKTEILGDTELKKFASQWQMKIIELEMAKIGEQKELFRDTLFLRNEWVKSLLNYLEMKEIDNMLYGLNVFE